MSYDREAFRIYPGNRVARTRADALHPHLWNRLVACWNPGVLGTIGNAIVLPDLVRNVPLAGAASRYVREARQSISYNGSSEFLTATRRPEYGDISGDFTASVWVKPRATPAGYPMIFSQSEDYKGWCIYFYAVNGRISTIASQNGTNWNFGVTTGQGVVYTANTWLHVLMRKQGSTFNTPKDGIVSGQQAGTFTGTPSNTTSTGIVSGKHYSAAEYGNMEVGEMCIWHRYLSDAEVYQVGALGWSPATPAIRLPRNRYAAGIAGGGGGGARSIAVVVCG
jgi:hypothetical protein